MDHTGPDTEKNPEARAPQEPEAASDGTMEVERERKDDGRYIIFYTFEEGPER